jgi:hypothetical protein
MIRIPNDMATDRIAQVRVRLVSAVPSRTARWTAGVVVAVTVTATGALVIVGLTGPGSLPGADTDAARILGGYQAVRTIVLTGAMGGLLLVRAWAPLRVLLILNAAVQAGDAAIGAARHSAVATVGPLCFAAALAWAAFRLGATAEVDASRPGGSE